MTRLTDEQLADVAARVANPRCHVCEGRCFVPVARDVSVPCQTCDGTGNFALSTVTMAEIIAELRAHRAAALADEERVALRGLRSYIAENLAPQPAVERALAVIARLTKETP